nr:MAG TPA: hypothetical protein [Caudoviricetes sp.]
MYFLSPPEPATKNGMNTYFQTQKKYVLFVDA